MGSPERQADGKARAQPLTGFDVEPSAHRTHQLACLESTDAEPTRLGRNEWLEQAVADEFINELPDKYQTTIGENGVRLSGGQKQRLSIARAILKNAPIILLDEATSSLDTESEQKVQNAIFNLTKNKTTLVIAHRLSTIKKADNIIVMRDGNIVSSGKHDLLMQTSGDYKNLYNKQVI